MAYTRRTLATAFRHFPRRVHPSLPHVLSHDDSSETPSPSAYRSISQFHTSPSPSQASGFGFGFGFYLPLGLHMSSIRCYSSAPAPTGGSNEIEYIKDVTEVLTDASTEAAASAAAAVPASFPGEVAAAAADSFFPVAALQHLIDGVHSFTGLNWWAAIALTTILIRGATIPLLIQQMKDTIKLGKLRPELEKLKDEMQNSPELMQENSMKMKALFNKHGVTPFSPLKGLLIQGPIFMSFFFAISNMVEKVPSLKGGGILWFTDLTTPDPMYIFPVLTSLAFLATVEFNMQEGLEGNPVAKTMKNFSRVVALLTVPFTASFPKAIFCYWITSNLFSLIYGTVLKRPAVKKFLNIPIITPQPQSTAPPSFSFLGLSKPLAQIESSASTNTPTEQSQPQHPAKASSLAAMNHRIGKLEKTVKARQKPKRR